MAETIRFGAVGTPVESIGAPAADHGGAVHMSRPEIARRLNAAHPPLVAIADLRAGLVARARARRPGDVLGAIRFRRGSPLCFVRPGAG